MPLFLAIIGILAVITAIKGNASAVGTQFNTTFFGSTSQTGFIVWFGSILGIALIFRIIQAPKAGELFIALLILVYFLDNNGVLGNIETSLQSVNASSSSSGSSSSSTTNAGQNPLQAAQSLLGTFFSSQIEPTLSDFGSLL